MSSDMDVYKNKLHLFWFDWPELETNKQIRK